MRHALVAAAALAGFALASTGAEARFSPGLQGSSLLGPGLVEPAACVVRRERVVRPNGRVIVRTVRRCGVGPGPRLGGCRVARERVVRPNGRVIVRTVRRCG